MSDNVEIPTVEAPVAVEAAAEATPAVAPAVVAEAAPAADAGNRDEEKAKILKQVEFYFSDSNLPSDKFLSELVKKTQDGYVSIAKIASFKRMRDFKDMALIVEALRESKSLLEVSADGEKVRRKIALLPSNDYFQRSVYAKGFGEETPSLQMELEQFFGGLGDVKQVRLRRKGDTNEFKGSVFVEYATLDEANKISSSKLQYNGQDLLVMSNVIEVQVRDADKDAAKVVADLQAKDFEFNGIKPEISVVSDEDAQKFFDEKKSWEANFTRD
ncbi:hypothetical protein BGX29_010247, partial [Mortierella sp. GBA35]